MYFDKIFASVCFIIRKNSFVVSLTLIGPNKLLRIALYLVHWVRKYKMGQVQFLDLLVSISLASVFHQLQFVHFHDSGLFLFLVKQSFSVLLVLVQIKNYHV